MEIAKTRPFYKRIDFLREANEFKIVKIPQRSFGFIDHSSEDTSTYEKEPLLIKTIKALKGTIDYSGTFDDENVIPDISLKADFEVKEMKSSENVKKEEIKIESISKTPALYERI